MADQHDVAYGLYDWVNSLQVAEAVNSAEQLSDGRTIWRILRTPLLRQYLFMADHKQGRLIASAFLGTFQRVLRLGNGYTNGQI